MPKNGEEKTFVNLNEPSFEYKINFIRPAAGTLLRASAEIVRAGKTLLIARIDVSSGTPDKCDSCAIAQATYMRVETAV